MSFADKVNYFNRNLKFNGKLPGNISIMNPFRENPDILPVTNKFYKKYFDDDKERTIILGINPGRHGAGVTGIAFTDTIRLNEYCGIKIEGQRSYETSSEFVYMMIEEFGGVKKFYSKYFISAVCPLGFTKTGSSGKETNYNYYDDKKLTDAVYDFIVETLKKQLSFGINRDICYCLGSGKNYKFLTNLNEKEKLFGEITPLDHPRYIMQYKRKHLQKYINNYMDALK